MQMTFRWYGKDDPVTLEKIRQIPGVTGIVSAIYDIPVGEEWSYERIEELKKEIEAYGLRLSVIESVPVHEDITYDEIYKSEDNLWNFMFFTGYFKKTEETYENRRRYITIKIPNWEVDYIFREKVLSWFEEKVKETDQENQDELS